MVVNSKKLAQGTQRGVWLTKRNHLHVKVNVDENLIIKKNDLSTVFYDAFTALGYV